jgi:hypothetical protein
VNRSEVLPVCKAPQEEAGFRREKEEERLPDRSVERTEGERAFQRKGTIEANDRD